LQLKTTFQIFV